MAKRTIKINIKLPSGIAASKELEAKATQAANNAIAEAVGELAQAHKLAKRLAAEGIQITPEELMSRKVGKAGSSGASKAGGASKAAKKTGTRKRVVLTDANRQQLAADLKAGMKIKEAVTKYGVSPATVSNIKTQAGLTDKRK